MFVNVLKCAYAYAWDIYKTVCVYIYVYTDICMCV